MTLRQNRAQELAARVLDLVMREKMAEGAHLREQWLADQLEVSRSPIRAALQYLSDQKIANYEPMRGYFLVKKDPQLLNELQEAARSPEDDLYEELTRERFSETIAERIEVSDLIRRYKVTRSLANRVLSRLSGEGVLEPAPGRGWRFIPALTTQQAYGESYRFRMTLEPAMLLEESFRVDPALFERIRKAQEAVIAGQAHDAAKGELFDSDALFHEGLAACCGNRFMEQAVRQQTRMRRISDYQAYSDRDRIVESCREHLQILDALEAGRKDEAAALMKRHIAISEGVRPEFG